MTDPGTGADISAEEVARFLRDELERLGGDYLSQAEAVDAVNAKYGEPFVRYNASGNLALSKDVLAAFKRLTPELIWDRREKAWRIRTTADDPNKRQSD